MRKNLPIFLGILCGIFLSILLSDSFKEKNLSIQTSTTDNTSINEIVNEPIAMTRWAYLARVATENQTVAKESIVEKKNISVKVKSTVSKKVSKTKTSATNTSKPVTKGEVLDWWKSARYTFRIGDIAKVTDIKTGKTFKIKRTMGSNHADCEALTIKDTQIIKSTWGNFSWDVRPVIISVRGRNLVASMSAMPHAGVDAAPAYKVVSRRSGGYSRGENLDVIKNNGMNGHIDVHFLNSTRHKDGRKDSRHQQAIAWAAKRK